MDLLAHTPTSGMFFTEIDTEDLFVLGDGLLVMDQEQGFPADFLAHDISPDGGFKAWSYRPRKSLIDLSNISNEWLLVISITL